MRDRKKQSNPLRSLQLSLQAKRELYPDVPPQAANTNLAVGDRVNAVCQFAKEHPLIFGAGALVTGAAAVMMGPALISLGHGIAVVGGILFAAGLLSVFHPEGEGAAPLIPSGLVLLLAGTGIGLVGYALTVGGIVAVVVGSGFVTKVIVEETLKQRIKSQLKDKSITELIDISCQLS
ncbi:hypothetical protein P4C99_17660 [Pontiellaceae bacterium B1224]|nr:hypothetical protein [Pontiellaceae bacterium B1224]